ncbi:Uncharacterised protein [Mycobacteroides abscessus subsp. abscessus]|nr:Uncharacterised protein [Mycobacteroides abscessus subsp. abscessus]
MPNATIATGAGTAGYCTQVSQGTMTSQDPLLEGWQYPPG